MREAKKLANAKARKEQTPGEVEKNREQDRAQKQVARARERDRVRNEIKEASMETVDKEDKYDLSLSIDVAIKDVRTHLHQTKDQNDATIHRAHVCIVFDYFI